MRPRISPRMFIYISEKTSTSIDPSFLWAALLYSSHEPTMTSRPAIVPQTCIKVASAGSVKKTMGDAVSMKAPSMVMKPAISDSAKAAVGFGSLFVAKAIPDRQGPGGNLSTNCNRPAAGLGKQARTMLGPHKVPHRQSGIVGFELLSSLK